MNKVTIGSNATFGAFNGNEGITVRGIVIGADKYWIRVRMENGESALCHIDRLVAHN